MAKLKKVPFAVIHFSAMALLAGSLLAGNLVALYWNDALEGVFGGIGGDDFKSLYTSAYSSQEELLSAQKGFVLQVSTEGAVLLKNDNAALPLSSGNKVSVFGHGSVEWVAGGKGSGSVATDTGKSVKKSLEEAGLQVNDALWQFNREKAASYPRGTGTGASGGNEAGDWRIGEFPQSEYTDAVKSSYASYNDAAIIVLSRVGGEGSDLPKDMARNNELSADKHYQEGTHYLELDPYEKDLLKAVKAAGFKKTILIVNSANAFELDFLYGEEYGLDAAFWLAGTGNNGIDAIGQLVVGKSNFSGRTVDTFSADHTLNPTYQNHGDYRYVDSDGELTDQSYTVYAEGIYQGYRYYETRYEDVVTGRDGAGAFDYGAEVVYPFGYGLSYTTFSYSGLALGTPDEKGNVSVTVKVTNTGSVAGKEVVQLYAQQPYTAFDQQHHIEKSAVKLIDFGKTKTLVAGESETLTLSFNPLDLASYDAEVHQGYLLEASEDYCLSIGHDAHDALNNVLLKKGVDATNLVASPYSEAKGNPDLAVNYAVAQERTFKTAATGKDYANLFSYADLTKAESKAYDATFHYLSRSNWSQMDGNGIRYATDKALNVPNANVSDDNQHGVWTTPATTALIEALKAEGFDFSGNPKEKSSYGAAKAQGKDNGLSLKDFAGKDKDDVVTKNGKEYTWDDLIDQMSEGDLHKLFYKAGYCTQAIESVGKEKEFDYDGPAGIANYLSGKTTFGYMSEVVLSATYNKDLALQFGKLIGEDGLLSRTTGWYAPAVNLHRSPFSGRNYEYFSEDPYISGVFGREVVKGAQSMGMYCDLKHFAANDMETNRSDIGCVAIWASEQTLREMPFKAFQMPVEEASCHGIMTTMSRIGHLRCFGNYSVITSLLREEWGFQGLVITDYTTVSSAFADEILSAGGDCIMNTGGCKLTEYKSGAANAELRRAAKNILVTVANSNIMGTGSASKFPVYKLMLIGLDSVVGIGIALWAFLVIRRNIKMGKQQ